MTLKMGTLRIFILTEIRNTGSTNFHAGHVKYKLIMFKENIAFATVVRAEV